MGLDYSQGCVNFRDVGEVLCLLADREALPTRRILRGGKLECVDTPEQIGSPGTIINLRRGADPQSKRFGADYWQFAASNDLEKYHTANGLVRRWLNDVVACVASEVQRFPVLVHCTSGKDRTGVVVAALLFALGIERELIVQEYLWSAGEVQRDWIESSLDGIGEPVRYFSRVDLHQLHERIYRTQQ